MQPCFEELSELAAVEEEDEEADAVGAVRTLFGCTPVL